MQLANPLNPDITASLVAIACTGTDTTGTGTGTSSLRQRDHALCMAYPSDTQNPRRPANWSIVHDQNGHRPISPSYRPVQQAAQLVDHAMFAYLNLAVLIPAQALPYSSDPPQRPVRFHPHPVHLAPTFHYYSG